MQDKQLYVIENTSVNALRFRKKFIGKARKSAGMRRTFSYVAVTKDVAQRSIWTFYETVILISLRTIYVRSGTSSAMVTL